MVDTGANLLPLFQGFFTPGIDMMFRVTSTALNLITFAQAVPHLTDNLQGMRAADPAAALNVGQFVIITAQVAGARNMEIVAILVNNAAQVLVPNNLNIFHNPGAFVQDIVHNYAPLVDYFRFVNHELYANTVNVFHNYNNMAVVPYQPHLNPNNLAYFNYWREHIYVPGNNQIVPYINPNHYNYIFNVPRPHNNVVPYEFLRPIVRDPDYFNYLLHRYRLGFR